MSWLEYGFEKLVSEFGSCQLRVKWFIRKTEESLCFRLIQRPQGPDEADLTKEDCWERGGGGSRTSLC